MPPKKDTEKKTQEPEKRGKRNAGKETPADTKIQQDGSENGEEPAKRSRRYAGKVKKMENVDGLKVTNGGPPKKISVMEEELESEEAPKKVSKRKGSASDNTNEQPVVKKTNKKATKKEKSIEELEEDEKGDEPKTQKASSKKKETKDNAEPVENKTSRAKRDKSDNPGPPEKSKKKNAKENMKDVPKPAEKTTKKPKGKEGKPDAKKKRETKTKPDAAEQKEPMNKTGTDWKAVDFTCTKKNAQGQTFNLKISTWNIGGVKSWVKKGCHEYLQHERPDIFCIQETKSNEDNVPKEITEIKEYKQYWCSSDKNGYAGVALFTLKPPIKVTSGINDEALDEDGRCLTAEFDNYYVVCVYVPNAGRKLVTLPKRLEWNEKFKQYIKELDKSKPVILCGDMNVSHQEIDLARPKSNTKNAGFTQEERDGMTDFLENGFVDTWRTLYPDKADAYTFWTYMSNARSNNIGWRLDYFIVSERIMGNVCDNVIRSNVFGSDHCPVTLFVNI